jgi:hypothetical protein
VGDLAHSEGGTKAAAAFADDDTFKGLEALTVTFLDLDLYHDRVTGAEFGQIRFHLRLFDFLDDLVAAAHCVAPRIQLVVGVGIADRPTGHSSFQAHQKRASS